MTNLVRTSKCFINGAQLYCLVLLTFTLALDPVLFNNYVVAQSKSKFLFQIQSVDAFPDPTLPRRLRTIFGDRIKARFDCVEVDLNNDGLDEKFATDKSFKGSGTYPWLLFDPQMDYLIGDFDATIIYVLNDLQNDYYVLECFCQKGHDVPTVTYYAFNGRKYQKTKSIELHGQEVDQFFQDRKGIPHPDDLRPVE